MDKIIFQQPEVKKKSRYEIVQDLAGRLFVKRLLGELRGISDQDLLQLIRSVESKARDDKIDFPFAWNIIMKGVKKSLIK